MVIGWLTRLVVVFAVVGVLVFDGVSLGVAELAVEDTAVEAARTAADELAAGRSPQAAYDVVTAQVESAGADWAVPAADFRVTPGQQVSLTVVRVAPTLVLHRIPGSERWLTATAVADHEIG